MYLQVVSGVCSVYAFWPNQSAKSIFGVILVMIEYFIPLCILMYCYGRIVWMLTRRIESYLSKIDNQSNMFQIARKNTLKTLLLVGLCFVICWSGSQFNYLLYNIGYPADWNGTFFKVITLMAFGNCMINPFVYLMKYKDFQEGLKYLFMCTQREGNLEGSLHTTETAISMIKNNKGPKCWMPKWWLRMLFDFKLNKGKSGLDKYNLSFSIVPSVLDWTPGGPV